MPSKRIKKNQLALTKDEWQWFYSKSEWQWTESEGWATHQYSCKKPQPVYSNAALVATSKAAPVTVHNSVVAAYNSASARVNPVAQRVPIVPSLQNEAAAIIHKPMTVTATNTQMTNVVSSGVFCSHGQRDMNSSSRTFERHPVTPHQQQLHAAATHSKIYAILEHRLISTNQHRPNYVALSAVALWHQHCDSDAF